MARTNKVTEDRREQIIDAAMRVFAQKGFIRATNKDVAHEAGITTGLIYYYFASKEALLQAILETRSPLQVVTQLAPEALELPPEAFLPMLVKRVLSIAESEQFVGIIRVVLPELLHNPQVSPVMLSFIQRVLHFLGTYLQRQIAKGLVRADIQPEWVGQILAGSLISFVLRRQILHDLAVMDFTHEEIAQAIVALILDGIRPH